MPTGVGATSEAGRACRRDNLIVWNKRDFALADELRFDVNLSSTEGSSRCGIAVTSKEFGNE
jgi:hypothetical protein